MSDADDLNNQISERVDEIAEELPVHYWGPMEFRRVVDQRVLDQIARRACQRFFLLILRGETLENSITELAEAVGHQDPSGEASRLRREIDGHPYRPAKSHETPDDGG